MADALRKAEWSCTSTPTGQCAKPDDLDVQARGWMPARVPGTVAAALEEVGAGEVTQGQLDGQDWWFRCRFPRPLEVDAPDGWILECDGLATLADLWLNGVHLLRSESMFRSHTVPVPILGDDNELCFRFAALTPVLGERRPRPRWKAQGVVSQNLRWIRTTLLGRQAGWAVVPPPVGPWRPVRLRVTRPVEVAFRRVLATSVPGPRGTPSGAVTVQLDLTGSALGGPQPVSAEVTVAGRTVPMSVTLHGDRVRVSADVVVEQVKRWWPHTHGDQPLYPVRVDVAGHPLDLGEVGFRTVEVRRDDGGFSLVINGEVIFCRGACWYPPDPVGYNADDSEIEHLVDLARRGGMNMLRIPGGTVYEDERFFAACDRAGVMVWQESMLGHVDPPDDEGFAEEMVTEVTEVLVRAAAHPCLSLFCGGQELEEQPAMLGLSRERWTTPLIHALLPELVGRLVPGLPYVSSSPSGGDLPFQTDVGVSHYFAVGVFLFPLADLRRASPRFVAEGLAFAVPPERASIDEEFGGDLTAHHDSGWKRAVHRDAGSWFDLEDVRDHYAATLFDVDMAVLWRSDPERALDLGRAAVTEIMGTALAEWRRTSSQCSGFLAIGLRDLRPGPGWGVVDSFARPKAPWYALARASAPVVVLATDEGVNGLSLHLVNDTGLPVSGTLVIGLHTDAHTVEQASCGVVVPARGGHQVHADALFDGFRDLTYAYRFGPRPYELVTAELVDASGQVLADTGYLPGGPARASVPDVGLQTVTEAADDGSWRIHVSARRFAQYIHVDVPGFVADDSWFHLPPGGHRTTVLQADPGGPAVPRGWVRALNSVVAGAVAP
jgi:beta-mannosidase